MQDSGETVLHPVGLAALVLCAILHLVLPRKYALWPVAFLLCFVAKRQCIAIAGLNFFLIRIMVLFVSPVRLVIHGELRGFRFNRLDLLVFAYGLIYLLMGMVNFGPASSDFKTRLGYMTETLAIYMLVRVVVRTRGDLHSVIRCFAWISLPTLAFFLVEHSTSRNLFSMFGGVPPVDLVREGRIRCMGPYAHPILAGVYWASVLPLFLAEVMLFRLRRPLFVVATAATCGIIVLTASSTPALGLMTAFAGMAAYRLRRLARPTAVAAVFLLFCLHLVMKAPVWHLIARINVTSGDSGYHRFLLVDGFINHWREWYLTGSVLGTAHWGHFTFDAADQYVVAGIQCGLIGLVLFLACLLSAFLRVGQVERRARVLGWALGVSLGVQCVSFLGISIWGQFQFMHAFTLALIGSASMFRLPRPRRRPRRPRQQPQAFVLAPSTATQ